MSRTIPHRLSAGITLCLIATLAGCASTPPASVQSEEEAIRELSRRWLQAVGTKNLDAITQMYAADAQFMAPNAPAASGHAGIRTAWEGLLGWPNVNLTFEPMSITVARSGDMASEIGTYRLSFDAPQGRVDDEGRYVVTWRKTNGEWKAISDIVTSSKPLPEPPPAATAAAPAMAEGGEMQIQGSAGLQWSDINVPGFAPGLKMAVIHGDPSSSGDYALRLRFPSNYEFPAHWHPKAEHLTVLQGSFRLAMGERVDRAALKTYAPGDFLYLPAKMAHYGGVQGETIIQLHGMGPFEINLAGATP
jgi:ketosteroid isomerase-like protein